MANDFLGNPNSSVDPVAIAAIDDFVGGFLGYEARIESVIGAADVFPGDALLNRKLARVHTALDLPRQGAQAARRAERVLSPQAP